jgi:hypothetical protein
VWKKKVIVWQIVTAKEVTMYRIIKFKDGKGKTLARFNTEEEVAAYHRSAENNNDAIAGETTKKYCIVELKRGADSCKMLAQFDTPEEAAKYYETVKDKHEPFGPFLVLSMELQPGGEYDDLQRKPQYRQTWGKKAAPASSAAK